MRAVPPALAGGTAKTLLGIYGATTFTVSPAKVDSPVSNVLYERSTGLQRFVLLFATRPHA
jgi:hypothetical protein